MTTKIEWTDETWNPVRGCAIVSKGCTHCYAMKQAHRFSGPGRAYEGLTKLTNGGPVWTGKVTTHPELLDAPLRWRTPRRVFVNSMSDLFHEDVPVEFIDQAFAVMTRAHDHTFQILTKRPERMLNYLTAHDVVNRIWVAGHHVPLCARSAPPQWPLPNVWLGVSVEDQAAADERIPPLLQTPAAVRWISAEPLLGPVDLTRYIVQYPATGPGPYLDWVVAGGESGPGARPMHPDWVRSLRSECALAGVPFFFKQWGDWAPFQYIDATTGKPLLNLTPSKKAGEILLGGPREGTTPLNMKRVGKKFAGRHLDGALHDEYPGPDWLPF